MRIIKPTRIHDFVRACPDARPSLERWLDLATHAQWRNLLEVRRAFRSADEVKVASGRTVVVFNIAGNNYRLITAIHYNLGKVFVLRLLRHTQYSRDSWKDLL